MFIVFQKKTEETANFVPEITYFWTNGKTLESIFSHDNKW